MGVLAILIAITILLCKFRHTNKIKIERKIKKNKNKQEIRKESIDTSSNSTISAYVDEDSRIEGINSFHSDNLDQNRLAVFLN